MRKFAFAFLAAALAVPAFAAPGTDAPKPDKPKKEKRICKHVATTQSRMGDTVCKTAAEWEQEPNDDADKVGYRH